MEELLLKYANRFRCSFWFVPAVMACLAVALTVSVVELDKALVSGWLQRLGRIYSDGAEGASLLLSTVARSMIAIAGTVFSTTLVALSLVSSQPLAMALPDFGAIQFSFGQVPHAAGAKIKPE